MSQDVAMGAEGTHGTATNPQVCTALTHNGPGESKAYEPYEEENGAEDPSTKSSWGVSAVQGPQPEGSKQWGLSPKESNPR